MENLPCKNEECKSYGKPHPNCHCYGMAEGGEAAPSCSEKRAHKKECQYFQDGGEAQADGPMKFDDLIDDNQQQTPAPETAQQDPNAPVMFDDLEDDKQKKYTTTPQKIGSFIEGVAQGYAGPLATGAEKILSKMGVPNLSDEDINAREKENPTIHGVGTAVGLGTGLLTGTGELSLLGKAGKAVTALTGLENASRLGSAAVKGAIEAGLFQAGDNLTNVMLGKGDPSEAVGYTQANGIQSTATAAAGLGALIGLAGGAAGKGLEKLAESKFGGKMQAFLAGLGEAAQGIDPQASTLREVAPKSYDAGKNWYKARLLILGAGAGGYAIHDIKEGLEQGDLSKGLENAAKDIAIGTAVNLGAKTLGKVGGAALLKAIGDGANPAQIFQIMNHANQIDSGVQHMTKQVDSLFNIGAQKTVVPYVFDKAHRFLDQWVSDGGVDPEIQQESFNQTQPQVQQVGYAEGGEVQKKDTAIQNGIVRNEALEKVYPQQNMLLQQTKGRISNYLKALKPQTMVPKLPFDDVPVDPQKQRTYNNALNIAVKPMSILDQIKMGTLEQSHIQHMNSMYPELGSLIIKKITERLTDAQLKKEKPSYRVRQGLSLLLGTPLSSEFTPQGIKMAQSVFQQQNASQQAQQAAPPKKKKGTGVLSKSDQAYLTNTQANVARDQSTRH